MAIKALNSVAGFSVGEVPANIILANGDITSNNGTFTANISAGNVLTNNLLYANGTAWDIGGIPGGSNTQVQFNDAGEFGGVSNFTFDKATNILTVTGNIAGTNVNAGNLLTANFVTGVLTTANQPNVTSVGTLTGLVVGNGTANVTFVPSGANGGITATGNITAANFIGNVVGNISGNIVIPGSNTGVVFNDDGNANTSTAFTFNKSSNLVTASGNVSAGNLITGGVVSATGNVSGANLTTAGLVSATGNVSGGNITTGGVVSATGNITGANVTANSFVFASNIVSNASTNDTRIELGSSSGIIAITSAGNSTQFGPSGQITLGGASQIVGGTFGGSGIKLDTTQTDIFQNRGGNVTVQLGTGGTIANTWTFAQSGAFIAPGNITTTANANVGNLNTGGQVVATGNVTGGNLVTTGTANIGNLLISGTVQGNLIPSVSNTYSLGNGTNYWKDLFLSGNTITLGDQSVSSNANGVSLSNTVFMTTLSVSGNANVGNLGTAGLIIATGNVSGGNITTIGVVSATGNVSGGNLTTAGNLSVTGNANIGNIGTAGLVVATGNVSGGNLTTGGIVTATGNIETSANVVTDLIVGKTASVTITAVGSNQNVNLTPTGTGTVNVGNFIISNVATPLASTDAATKQYVDDVAQGLHTHDSCNAATQTTLASISGGTVTYNNGTSGVGATLTTTGTFTTIDGVTLSVGMRILVKNEVTAANNGIYDVTSSTVLTRSADFNTPTEMAGGDFTFVTAGTLYDNTGWVMPDPVTTVGTSPVVWVQFSGAGTYTAGSGLTLTGSVFSVNVAQPTITSVGTLTSLSISGNANIGNVGAAAGVFTSVSGNGSALSAITGANVTGQVGNALVAGTVYTNAQPNITSVGSLTSLTVTGNVTGGNLITTGSANVGTLAVTGTSNLGNVGNVIITGGTANYVLQTNGSGNLSWVVQAGSSAASNIANGTSNVNIPTVNGNVNITSAGNTTMVITGTGANVTGTFTASNNVTGAQLVSTIAIGTAPFVVTSTTQVANLNVATAGTVTTNAQGNITSVGSLTGLTVSNATGVVDFTTTANVTLGAVANLHISGGTSGQVLSTNGSGGLSFISVSSSSISNGTSNVNIPAVNGNVDITAAGNTVLVVTGTGANIAGTLNVTGNLVAGNITTSGSGGNISNVNNISANTFTSIITTGTAPFIVSSTTQVANLNVATAGTAGLAVAVTGNAQGNITSVGTLTSLDVTGNISGGNISTVGTANVGTLIVTGATTFGNLTANNVALNGGLTSNRSNVVVTTNTVIDQFGPGTFRTAKYIISASGDDGFQSVETLLIHDGTTSYITIYGSICSNNTADIIELSSNINGVSGNVAVYATGASANLKVNLVSTYIKT